MGKKKPVKIESWNMFGSHSVSIDAHRFAGEDDEYFYRVSLTYMLDDGEDVSDDVDQQKVITIFTDRFIDDIEDELREVVKDVAGIYDNMLRMVHVFDDEGNVIETLDLEEFMNPVESGKGKRVGNATFH